MSGPGEDSYPDPEIMEDNTTTDPTPSAVIHPRTSITHARGFISNPSGDLNESEIENGDWIKKIGNDGEIYLEYDDNGTVHKFTISLIDFKGNTKINEPPKEVKNTKIPSNSTIHGYIDDIPAMVRWTEHPFTIKEEVIWNSTMLKSVSYELKIQSKNITIDTTTLEFLYDGDHIGVSLDTPIIIDSGKLLDIPLDWSLSRAKDKAKDKYWTLDINWTYPIGSSAPYILDPTISFNSTTFKIEDGKLEVKTYQELWGIYTGQGTNVRYKDEYCAIDSNGVHQNVGTVKSISPDLDLSAMTDFTIDVRTTNADASWSLKIYLTDDGGNFARNKYYAKDLANDVTTTYTLSDFTTTGSSGTVDMSAIDRILVFFVNIDTAMAGNVICEIKDFKFTIPVKTSDLYDSTGRVVLYEDDFEGDDGLAADSYDSNFTVTLDGGGATAEIDDAQAPGGGSTSLLVYTDGNDAEVVYDQISMYDNARFKFHIRAAQENAECNVDLMDGATRLCRFEIEDNGEFHLYYGDGAAENNEVDVAYSANNDYEVWIDIDVTNDVCRYWIDGVMYPGPNADASGWDNFYDDDVGAEIDIYEIDAKDGTGSFWFDDIKIHVGYEDFSALSAPHDIDDISEAVSPSGTDYGRQTWDGDWWAEYGGSVAADSTDYIIGSNSIKATGASGTSHGVWFLFDDIQDVSNPTHLRFYFELDNIVDFSNLDVYVTKGSLSGPDDANISLHGIVTQSDKWFYLDLAIADFDEDTSYDPTDINRIGIFPRFTSTQPLNFSVDGIHFYGDSDAGVCFQGNFLDINGVDFIQDLGIYDLNQLHDTSDSDGNWTAVMDIAADNRTIEFSDVPNAGIASSLNSSTIILTGYDEDNHITWTSVGNIDPTNHWDGDPADGLNFILSNITWKYCCNPIFSENDIAANYFNIFNSDVVPQFHGGNHTVHGLTVRDAEHANTSLHTKGNHVFTEADIDGEKSQNIHQNTSGILVFINSTFNEDYHHLGEENATIISKNHNNTPDYIISTTHTSQDVSDIPEMAEWEVSANIYVLNGTVNIDMNTTLTNGSWTNEASAIVVIYNNTSLNMINSTFTVSDFTLNETGYLVESNFTDVSPVMTGTILTTIVDNSTSSNWVAYYNSWDGSGSIVYQPVVWGYDWGDGTSSSSNEKNQAHDYHRMGVFTVTVETTLLNGDNSSMEFLAGLIKIYANFTVVRTGGYYEFTDTSETNNTTIISWSWNFGDGSTSTQQNPGHRYLYEGEYIVNLTVIDNETNTDEILVSIEVNIPFPEQITYVIVPIIMSIVVLVIILVVMFKVVLKSVKNTIGRMT